MPSQKKRPLARSAILLLVEIKAAVETFDRGEANAFDVADSITMEVEAYHAAATPRHVFLFDGRALG